MRSYPTHSSTSMVLWAPSWTFSIPERKDLWTVATPFFYVVLSRGYLSDQEYSEARGFKRIIYSASGRLDREGLIAIETAYPRHSSRARALTLTLRIFNSGLWERWHLLDSVGLAILFWYTAGPSTRPNDAGSFSPAHRFSKPQAVLEVPLQTEPPHRNFPPSTHNPIVDAVKPSYETAGANTPMIDAAEPHKEDAEPSREAASATLEEGSANAKSPYHDKTESQNAMLDHKSMTAAVQQLIQTFSAKEGLEHNRKALLDTTRCMYDTHCTPRPRLVILVSAEIRNEEGAILRVFDRLDVSYIHSPGDVQWAKSVYALFSSQVKAVIFDRNDLKACFKDISGCLRSPQNLQGFPAWKMFSWNQVPDEEPASPLGYAWTLAAEKFPNGETYLGFSLEKTCRSTTPYVDPEERLNRAFIMAGLETYLFRKHNLWPPEYFEDAGKETGAQFVAGLDPVDGRLILYPETEGIKSVPSNLVELGKLSEKGVLQEMSKSKLLVGLWDPRELPLVFEALCLGVPVLNPIRSWDSADPSNRNRWLSQNTALNELDPPYVYNVFAGDYPAFKKAIADAMTHPIEIYIPEHMTEAAVEKRVTAFLDRDWRAEANKTSHLFLI
ncbi:hypothetical protein DFH09DRAFT_1280031 [Mycena vulgaris]|nr:hypothetical protein DFH09DRAFT_1280031 [Mycena vulgaris]